ncbi:hypothetical protein V8E54_011549 [Elaphomyces granulatus]
MSGQQLLASNLSDGTGAKAGPGRLIIGSEYGDGIEGIADSAYKNALVEFEEGDSELSSCRCFYVAFWGDLLESGRDYV